MSGRPSRRTGWLVAALATLAACGGDGERPGPSGAEDASNPVDDVLTVLDGFPGGARALLAPRSGDLDSIRSRRLVRLLTVSDPMFYGVDGKKQGGIAYESAKLFEADLNRRLGIRKRADHVRVILVPVRRDQLIPLLAEGRAELAAANLTVTEERAVQVRFSEPVYGDAREIVVSAPGVEAPESATDLSGRDVFVRQSSSYRESIEALNARLDEAGRPPARIVAVDEILEDGDILDLVGRGDIPLTVVDAHIAEFWKQIYPDLVLQPGVVLRGDADIAWALRPDAPGLQDLVNRFVREHRVGTMIGNVLVKRYVESPTWVRSVREYYDRNTIASFEPIFRKAEAEYGFDWRLLVAQAIQESGLDPNRRSPQGAVGLMQLMPATAREMGYTGDLTDPAANVEAAAKYLAHILDVYFPGLRDRDSAQAHLMALAAYNAGPTRISRLREEAESRGRDPDRWFDEMELVASREVGAEPAVYVQNIFKTFTAFRMLAALGAERTRARESPGAN